MALSFPLGIDGQLNIQAGNTPGWMRMFLGDFLPYTREGEEIETVYDRLAQRMPPGATFVDHCSGSGRSARLVRKLCPTGRGVLIERNAAMLPSLTTAFGDDAGIEIIHSAVEAVAPRQVDVAHCMHGIYEVKKRKRFEFVRRQMEWVRVGGYYILVMKRPESVGNWVLKHLNAETQNNGALFRWLMNQSANDTAWTFEEIPVKGTIEVPDLDTLNGVLRFFASDQPLDAYSTPPTVADLIRLGQELALEQQHRQTADPFRLFDLQSVIVMQRIR